MLKRLFLWLYAATYDVFNGPAERAGLREQRHDLLAQATGDTIEIGAGTGLNLTHYPPAVTRLALIEPDAYMSRRLRRRAAQLGRDAEILDATADQLPFPDASFDTAVVSFTVCSVPDEQAALSETRGFWPRAGCCCSSSTGELPKAPKIERTMIVGAARKPATA